MIPPNVLQYKFICRIQNEVNSKGRSHLNLQQHSFHTFIEIFFSSRDSCFQRGLTDSKINSMKWTTNGFYFEWVCLWCVFCFDFSFLIFCGICSGLLGRVVKIMIYNRCVAAIMNTAGMWESVLRWRVVVLQLLWRFC